MKAILKRTANCFRKLLSVVLAVAILNFPVVTAYAAGVGGWIEDNANIDGFNHESSQSAQYPSVVRNSGEWYAAWQETDSSGVTQIRVAKRNSSSQTWIPVDGGGAEGINYNHAKNAMQPKLVVYNNIIYAAWTEYATISSNSIEVRVARFDGGSTWTFVDSSNDAGLNYATDWNTAAVSVSSDSTGLYVAWAERVSGSDGSMQLHVKKYNGTTWDFISGNTQMGLNKDTTQMVQNTSVAADSGKLYITWSETIAGGGCHVFAKYYNGSAWSNISGDSGLEYVSTKAANGPLKIVLFKGNLYATWSEKNSSSVQQVRVKKYDGSTWLFVDGGGTDGLNYNTSEDGIYPTLVADSSHMYLGWWEKWDTVSQFRVTSYNEAPNTWTPLDSDGISGGGDDTGINMDYLYPYSYGGSLGLSDGELCTVFSEGTYPNYVMQFKKYDPTFSLPSDGAQLSSLSTSGKMYPAFDPDVYDYTILADKDTTNISITPTVADSDAKLIYNGSTIPSGSPLNISSLQTGDNNILIKLVSHKASIVKHINIRINRAYSDTQRVISPSADCFYDIYGSSTDPYPKSDWNSEALNWVGDDYEGDDYLNTSVLKFNYSFISDPSTITSASLSIMPKTVTDDRANEDPHVSLYGSNDKTWTDSSSSIPVANVKIGDDISGFAANTLKSMDVLSYVKTSDKTATFVMNGNQAVTDSGSADYHKSCYMTFYSSESSTNIPQLLLTVPDSIAPISAPTGILWDTTIPAKAIWSPVTGATGYTVNLYKSGTTDTVDTEPVAAGTTVYDFTSKITSTGSYTFKVIAKGEGTIFTDSAESTASAAYTYTAPLSAPSNIAWDMTINGKATWSAVTGATGYTVNLYKSGTTDAVDTEPVAAGTTVYDFTSKITSTGSYSFKVIAKGDGTTAVNSPESTASVAYAYTVPAIPLSAPSNIAWDATIHGKATWSEVTGATGYTVNLYKSGTTDAVDTEPVPSGTTVYDFTSKITSTGSYTFKVIAKGDGTIFADSAESTASAAYAYTAPASPLSAPSSIAWDTTIHGKATWSAVTGATGYTVNLYKSGTTDAVDTEPVAAGTTVYDFTSKITSVGSYSFKVIAKGDGTTTADSSESTASAAYTYTAPPVNKTLVSVNAPSAITGIANGTAKTAAALGLPGTVVLTTDNGNVNANVNWHIAGCSYDAFKTTEQTFTVSGAVTLPAGVINTNSISLTTNISVTVKSASGGDTTKKTITGFLPDYITKTVPYGSSFASLNLPDKIKAVGNELGGLWVKVTGWLHSTYQSNVPSTYTLTAVLDSGYVGSGYVDSGFVLGSGVSAPEIKVTIAAASSSSNNHSNSSSDKPSTTTDTGKTETKVDTTGNTATVTTKPDSVTISGDTTNMQVTVPSITTDNTATSTNGNITDTAKKTVVTINVPTESIVQQLIAKKDVDLTITVPSDVAKDTNANVAVTINANKEVLQAAKENLSDVTIKVKDADTQQLAYSWTFKGADLAKSTTPMTDVNIAMSVHLTTEVPKVAVITPKSKGLVLSFDHSGVLPSVASVTFSALEKGFKPGETLYFYYYNPTTKQIESMGKDAYTVDADGNVTVQIYHCSDYVLLPNAARSITLDTRTYTMAPKKDYEIGVKLTSSSDTTIKAYSSTKGVANVTTLKNGNVKVTGVKPGLTYIMIDVYDKKNKFLTHASVKVTVQNGVKPNGNSARQYGIF